MKNKEDLMTKIIKRFYGISGVLDEYRRSQVEHIGNNAFMLLFWYMLLANFVAALFATSSPTMSLWILIGVNLFFVIFIIGGYVIIATSRLNLTTNEIAPKHLVKAKRTVIFKGIALGLYFAIAFHFLSTVIDLIWEQENFFEIITSPAKIISSLGGGLLFGLLMYFVLRSRLKETD
ncbi:DUF3278 domain-containing protein [Lapidilactobacillus bayanensis]|uniref:DUF3278 domain-containing protein n=1 Tax=Lapidilactobacillus bayanensis TaxID=2485998 RepID=UPI000F79F8E3|nr:DUF3278 domain-containing protein [Lapidilactobacillus bayanensis]